MFQPELNAVNQLLAEQRNAIREDDSSVRSFNVGVNDGVEAGQTIAYCHVHLIPRREGDTQEPAGGVRGVISGKRRPEGSPSRSG